MNLKDLLFDHVLSESEQYEDAKESIMVLKDYSEHICAMYSVLHNTERFDATRFYHGLGTLAHLELDYGNNLLSRDFGFRALGDYVVTGDPLALYSTLHRMLEYASGKDDVDERFTASVAWELYKQGFEDVPSGIEMFHSAQLNELGKINVMTRVKSGYMWDLETLVEDTCLIKYLTENGSCLMSGFKGKAN